jgi:hypothetical protein
MPEKNVVNPKWLKPGTVKKGNYAQAVEVKGARVLRIGTRPIETDVAEVRECMRPAVPTRGVYA